MVRRRNYERDFAPLRVLIVDDNADHADSLATLVEMWGHTPAVAYDGEAGLRAACATRPDCLILDITMPKLDGYAVAERVRREPGLERVKLVAVSAYSDAEHTRRAQEVGFDYRLTKPAEPSELEKVLAMIENIRRLADKTEELTRKNAEAVERTEELTRQNVALAGETQELLREVKSGLAEVKQDMQAIKREVREVNDQGKEKEDRQGQRT